MIRIWGKDSNELDDFYLEELLTNHNKVAIGTMQPAFHWKFVYYKLKGFYTVKRYVGTDVWKILNCWWYRLEARICNFFINEHCFVHKRLLREYRSVFPKSKTSTTISGYKIWTYGKQFNILVYLPICKKRRGVDNDWLYGADIVQVLRLKHPEWKWLIVNQTMSPEIISELFMRADVYFRPTRHDGAPRMVAFAEKIGLSVVHDPKETLTVEDCESKLINLFRQWSQKC